MMWFLEGFSIGMEFVVFWWSIYFRWVVCVSGIMMSLLHKCSNI